MYNKVRSFRTTEQQFKTLQKMKSYNIDVSKFIREAVRDKIQKEYKELIPKKITITKSEACLNLMNQLNQALKNN